MEDRKGEGSQEGRAHDQETQTTFDMNGSVLSHAVPSLQPSVPNTDRSHSNYSSVPSWGARNSCQPPSYPENYYPYEPGYPPAPPHHHAHYYTGRTTHWHRPEGGVMYPQSNGAPVHVAPFRQNEFSHRNYYAQNLNESPSQRHAEIARPKPEWPKPYHQFSKPTIPALYLANIHGVQRNVQTEYAAPPSTATSLRSTVLDVPSPSSISSPRASAHLTRKRARSNTPSSIESIDVNMLIRNSPDSLLGCLAGSRLSSAGSFGHLSPLGFCTSSVCHRSQSSAALRPPPFITPPPIQPSRSSKIIHDQPRDVFPSSTTDIPKEENTVERMSCVESPPTGRDVGPSHMKEETMETCKLDSTTSPGTSEMPAGSDNEADEGQGEGEELNLTCHWRECTITFDNQDAMVKHVNGDHIKKEKRDFTCYWQECCREQKPFKAQYMLVVHMRRHTGEKPHVCKYDGCTKAYSRLENLKTHLRSHTGERPYVCEVEGCAKAFSNASDRAKHQNRTHSSVKPYVCKVSGCPKRYTDPSSLRKHTKTVHGDQGFKRLKSDTGKEKEAHNPSKKPSASQSHQTSSHTSTASTMVQSPLSDIKSPGSGSGNASIKKGGGYSSSVVSTSTCDVGSPSVDIPGTHEGSVGLSQPAPSGISPRSPSYINHMADIEGEWEPTATRSAVTTMQQVAQQSQSETVTLPKIHHRTKDIAIWVDNVSRIMSHTSSPRRSSENSHLSVDMNGEISRRSSESGWASNNDSRRSSQASLNPLMMPHPPSTQVPSGPKPQYGALVRNLKATLSPGNDSEAAPRRASEISNASSQSLARNRVSRNSSGYGSQSNLAIIRSPMFHRIPFPFPKGSFNSRMNGSDRPLRRMSDTVICEADSSEMSREEYRRRSEPAQNVQWNTRPDPMIQLSSSLPTNEAEPRETELINEDVDPEEFDAYLSPEQVQPIMHQTQPLRHFPYPPEEYYPDQQFPVESQTIHYRPTQQATRLMMPNSYHQPPAPNRIPLHRFSTQLARQQNQFYQRQSRLQSLPQGQMVTQYQQRVPMVGDCYSDPAQCSQNEEPQVGNYEAMLNSMEALSTDRDCDVNGFGLGNGNMVINDMNTLLNSLVEEDKYLDMQQNARRMAGSALSSLF